MLRFPRLTALKAGVSLPAAALLAVLFRIKTDLQRRLIPDPDDADNYLFLNGPGLISDGVVNTAALKLILFHVTRHQAKAAKVGSRS